VTALEVGGLPNHGSRLPVLLRESQRKPAGSGDHFVVDVVDRQFVKVGAEFQEPALLQELSQTRMTVAVLRQDRLHDGYHDAHVVGKGGHN